MLSRSAPRLRLHGIGTAGLWLTDRAAFAQPARKVYRIFPNRQRIAELVAKSRLPAMVDPCTAWTNSAGANYGAATFAPTARGRF